MREIKVLLRTSCAVLCPRATNCWVPGLAAESWSRRVGRLSHTSTTTHLLNSSITTKKHCNEYVKHRSGVLQVYATGMSSRPAEVLWCTAARTGSKAPTLPVAEATNYPKTVLSHLCMTLAAAVLFPEPGSPARPTTVLPVPEAISSVARCTIASSATVNLEQSIFVVVRTLQSAVHWRTDVKRPGT